MPRKGECLDDILTPKSNRLAESGKKTVEANENKILSQVHWGEVSQFDHPLSIPSNVMLTKVSICWMKLDSDLRRSEDHGNLGRYRGKGIAEFETRTKESTVGMTFYFYFITKKISHPERSRRSLSGESKGEGRVVCHPSTPSPALRAGSVAQDDFLFLLYNKKTLVTLSEGT